MTPHPPIDLSGQTALVTGGSGVLGEAMSHGLARAGARVAVLGRRPEVCERVAAQIKEQGGQALAVSANVLERETLQRARDEVEAVYGPVGVLVNAAGGNQPGATTTSAKTFFELDAAAAAQVFDLNFQGSFLACQVFGRRMAEARQGVIINVASMAALRPLTRVVSYSAAKAAVVNFTQWLAVHMAQEYGEHIRVNALAPGFFLTRQNRYLLIDPDLDQWTERIKTSDDRLGITGQPGARLGHRLFARGAPGGQVHAGPGSLWARSACKYSMAGVGSSIQLGSPSAKAELRRWPY